MRRFPGPAASTSEPDELDEDDEDELAESLSTGNSSAGRGSVDKAPLRKQTLHTTSTSESGGRREPQTSKTL